MTDNLDKTPVIVNYNNGQTNIFYINDDLSDTDYLTIARKIFKQQNYTPEKFSIKQAILIKEEEKTSLCKSNNFIKFESDFMKGEFDPSVIYSVSVTTDKYKRKCEYLIELQDGSKFFINQDTYNSIQNSYIDKVMSFNFFKS